MVVVVVVVVVVCTSSSDNSGSSRSCDRVGDSGGSNGNRVQ